MTTIRAFIAVEIDQPHKQKLSDLITHFKKSDADIKWVTENQMHLTLKFLGNIEQEKTQEISDILKGIADSSNSFDIQFSGIGAFPNLKRPRIVWIGIEKGSELLKLLNSKIEYGLEKIGFEKEKREYKTHLTLGRVKSLKNIKELTSLIDKTTLGFQDKIKIDKLTLFQSTLTPKGAVYAPLAEHIFRAE